MNQLDYIEAKIDFVAKNIIAAMESMVPASQVSQIQGLYANVNEEFGALKAAMAYEFLQGNGERSQIARELGLDKAYPSLILEKEDRATFGIIRKWLVQALSVKVSGYRVGGNLNFNSLPSTVADGDGEIVYARSAAYGGKYHHHLYFTVDKVNATHQVRVIIRQDGAYCDISVDFKTRFAGCNETVAHEWLDVITDNDFIEGFADLTDTLGLRYIHPMPEIDFKDTLKIASEVFDDVSQLDFSAIKDLEHDFRLCNWEGAFDFKVDTHNTIRTWTELPPYQQSILFHGMMDLIAQQNLTIKDQEAVSEQLRLDEQKKKDEEERSKIEALPDLSSEPVWEQLKQYCEVMDADLLSADLEIELDTTILQFVCKDVEKRDVTLTLTLPNGMELDYFEATVELRERVMKDLKALLN